MASQPTLSRFENAAAATALYRMAEAMADRVIAHHRRRLRGRVACVTIDLDPTDDPTHGAQQLTFFNSHYDTWCYLPIVGFLSFNKERAQYLVTIVLRPGNASAKAGAIGILKRLLTRVRQAFPRARMMKHARRLSKASGQTAHVYGEGRYAAQSSGSTAPTGLCHIRKCISPGRPQDYHVA